MSAIETRGEARKRKACERARSNHQTKKFETLEYDRRHNYDHTYNKTRKIERKQKRTLDRLTRDHQAKHFDVPLRVLEMDENFDKLSKEHSNWPQLIEAIVSKNALSEFHNKVSLDNLQEMPCAICSKLCCNKDFKEVQVDEINLSSIAAPQLLTDPSFEINFHYDHPYIRSSGLKIILNCDGFIPVYSEFQNSNIDNPFNL